VLLDVLDHMKERKVAAIWQPEPDRAKQITMALAPPPKQAPDAAAAAPAKQASTP